MGPMLLFVLGILSAVGFSLYQFGEHHRFDIVPDAKGGIFILDKKSAAINYCNDKTCSLVGNGTLPSQIMNNPAALVSMQGAIMGAPAPVVAPEAGQVPNGMNANIAASGSGANAAQTDAAAVQDDGDVQNLMLRQRQTQTHLTQMKQSSQQMTHQLRRKHQKASNLTKHTSRIYLCTKLTNTRLYNLDYGK